MSKYKVGKTYKTHRGDSVRLVDDDGVKLTGVITEVNGNVSAMRWNHDGVFLSDQGEKLFLISLEPPEPVEVTIYLNVYRNIRGCECSYIVCSYDLLKMALHRRDTGDESYIDTFPFSFKVPDDE